MNGRRLLSVMTILAICLTGLAGCNSPAAASGAPKSAGGKATTIRDIIWLWATPGMDKPGEHTVATYAQADGAQKAKILDAPNMMMAGAGLPDDQAEAERLTEQVNHLARIAWEISADGGGPPFAYEKRMAQVRALVDKYPKIEAVILDDMSTVARSKGFKPEHIRRIRELLPGKYSSVKIWGVVYTMSLHQEGIDDYIRELDVIMLPEWHANKVGEFEKHVAYLEEKFPDKPIILCLYLYDYGNGRRIPQEFLEQQFDISLKLARQGRIIGIEITTINEDADAVGWTRDWIKRYGDIKIAPPPAEERRKISKLNWLIHPVCWSMGMQGDQPPALPAGYDPQDYLDTWEWEKKVNEQQKRFISNMGDDEVLLIHPIGGGPAMKGLIDHAAKELGDRSIVMTRNSVNPPEALGKLEQPIKHFLEDDDIEGKAEFLAQVPEKIQAELAREIRKACKTLGYDWDSAVLEVIYSSRLFAMDIEAELEKRGLYFDPDTVELEAFGEGFEECAMTWKAMVPHYLGIDRGVENNFGLSVGGLRFLSDATWVDRVDLGRNVRLFLWRSADDRAIGFFVQNQMTLADPQLFAHVPLNGPLFEMWTQIKYGTKLFPTAEKQFDIVDGCLRIPILNTIRRDSGDGAYYVIADDIDVEGLRRLLTDARISE